MTRKEADAAFNAAVERYQAKCSAELKYTTWDHSTVAERGMFADTIAEAIQAAVAEERERCEMVARRYNPESWGHANLAVSYNTAQNIADIISGKVPDLQPKPEKVP
jgi:hypothetical protein